MPNKVLVTGGTGFVGAYLLWELAGQGQHVMALKRKRSSLAQVQQVFALLGGTQAAEQLACIHWLDADLTLYPDVLAALQGVEVVYHCAAVVSFDPAQHNHIIETNILMAQNVVDACLAQGVQRLVHVSSIAALGASPTGMTNEDTPWTSNKRQSAYAIAKHASEMVAWQGAERGLPVVVVQPSVILGVGNWAQGSPRFFSFIGGGTWFYPGGSTGFVDVRDVARAMVLLAHQPSALGQRFVLSASNLSFGMLFAQIAHALGRKAPRYRATKPLLWVACAWEWLRCRCTGAEPAITPQSVRASGQVQHYQGSKVLGYIPGWEYTPIAHTVQWAAKAYLDYRYTK